MGTMMHFATGLRGTTLALALACAHTQPAAQPPPTAPPPAAPAAPASAADQAGTRDVGGADGIARLCGALRDESGMHFEGNEVARAMAREEHERRRAQASEETYAVLVPPGGFAFRGYDLDDRRLTLDSGRNFVLADGVELSSTDREGLAFSLAPEAAETAIKGQEQGRLGLRLVFRPAHSELRRDGCVRTSGGRVVKLAADVLAFALVGPDGATLARGQVADYVDDTPVASPQITFARPRTVEGREIPETVASAASKTLGPALLPCYRKALESRPNLRGTLVIELRVLADGHIESPRMQMSSLGDEALVACSVAKAAHAHLAGVGATPRMSLPVVFSGKEDR
jgi:hypothetical protein